MSPTPMLETLLYSSITLESQKGWYLRTDNMKTSLISHALFFLSKLSKKSQVNRQHPPCAQLIINLSRYSIRCFHTESSSPGSMGKKWGKGNIKVLGAVQWVQGSVSASHWRFPPPLYPNNPERASGGGWQGVTGEATKMIITPDTFLSSLY